MRSWISQDRRPPTDMAHTMLHYSRQILWTIKTRHGDRSTIMRTIFSMDSANTTPADVGRYSKLLRVKPTPRNLDSSHPICSLDSEPSSSGKHGLCGIVLQKSHGSQRPWSRTILPRKRDSTPRRAMVWAAQMRELIRSSQNGTLRILLIRISIHTANVDSTTTSILFAIFQLNSCAYRSSFARPHPSK